MQGLPQSDQILSKLFRKVVAILQADPTLRTVVGKWKTYSDRDGSGASPAARGNVTLALFPFILANQSRFTPTSDRLTLAVRVTMTFDSSDAGDYLDLWLAVQRAIFPVDETRRNAILLQLQALGSLSEPTFQSPTPDDAEAPTAQKWVANGTILLEHIEITRNPS